MKHFEPIKSVPVRWLTQKSTFLGDEAVTQGNDKWQRP
jgi:hypothetical protein